MTGGEGGSEGGGVLIELMTSISEGFFTPIVRLLWLLSVDLVRFPLVGFFPHKEKSKPAKITTSHVRVFTHWSDAPAAGATT